MYRQQITSNGFFFSCLAKWEGWAKAGFRVTLKESFFCGSLFLYYIKQIYFMLPCACSVIDHRRRQNVVGTSGAHSAIVSCATFLCLPHFDVICDLLLTRSTAIWNLFVKYKQTYSRKLLCKDQEKENKTALMAPKRSHDIRQAFYCYLRYLTASMLTVPESVIKTVQENLTK